MEIISNNSREVKTVVETFVVEETAELIYDGEKLQEYERLVSELELEGQVGLKEKDKSPVPFLHMKRQLVRMFEILCPSKVAVERFNISPIPVEILGLISLSKKEGYFDKIEIWYDDKKDPVCIGLRYTSESDRKNNYTWCMEKYLIGKWGDVKQSFEELLVKAKERHKQNELIKAKQQIRNAQSTIDNIDLETDEYFN